MKVEQAKVCLVCDEVWGSARNRCPNCDFPAWTPLSWHFPSNPEALLPGETDEIMYGERPVDAKPASGSGLLAEAVRWPSIAVALALFVLMAIALAGMVEAVQGWITEYLLEAGARMAGP